MKKSWFLVSMVAFASLAVAQDGSATQEGAAPQSETRSEVGIAAGKMLVAANGARLGAVYRVTQDGSAQLIVDGKMVTVPASTLSVVDGKLTTSLSKSEVSKLR